MSTCDMMWSLCKRKLKNLSMAVPSREDMENVERKKTRFELILLSLVVFGIEICYAAETAFVTPILQKIGVPIQYMSMVWGVSPIVGFFACPILGSLSDVCTSALGRRRPFIIIYSVGILIGLLLTGYGHDIGQAFSGSSSGFGVILVTIVGVILLDFDCDACQSPSRAYLIDISQNSDHSIGLSMFTVMAGAGGAIGYLLGGIPWAELSSNPTSSKLSLNSSDYDDNYYQEDMANDHKEMLFTFVAVIYVICALISISSFKEIPLGQGSVCDYEQFENDALEDQQQSQKSYETMNSSNRASGAQNHLETLRYYLLSIFKMPTSLKWLCVTHGLCWMSLLCYSLYFTDFVGEEIYGGAPSYENAILHKRYDDGVRVGSLFMSLYSVSCCFYSFFLQKLTTRFSTKYVYMFSQLIYCFGMLILAFSKSLFVAGLTSLTAGVMYSSLFTIPFILVANYHSQDSSTFELLDNDQLVMESQETELDGSQEQGMKKSASTSSMKRGLGTDLSFVSSMVFVAQFLLSFLIGPLMKYIGTKTVVLYVSSALSLLAAISATQLLYQD